MARETATEGLLHVRRHRRPEPDLGRLGRHQAMSVPLQELASRVHEEPLGIMEHGTRTRRVVARSDAGKCGVGRQRQPVR